MAAKRPASQSDEVTPTSDESGEAASAAVASDPTPAAPDSVPAAAAAEPAAPGQQVVYVEAPKPFVPKSNRVFGVLIALLSTVIFAAVTALAGVAEEVVNQKPVAFGFISTLDFWAPVILFAIAFIVLVLIVNRAGWAAYVVGSLVVALFVYFGTGGAYLALHASAIPSNEVPQHFTKELFRVATLVTAVLAREVSLWMGFAIAARGRKVKARNVEARVLYDQEIAAKRAEYEQANARNSGATSEIPEPAVEAPAAP
jgi:energy-converting hydrogenase Eha subunit A